VDEPAAPEVALAAQVLFATEEDQAVRCDLVTLGEGTWGGRTLPSGSPISLALRASAAPQLVALTAAARSWAKDMRTLQLAMVFEGGQRYLALASDDGQVMLGYALSP
jgi:hypothetical protein